MIGNERTVGGWLNSQGEYTSDWEEVEEQCLETHFLGRIVNEYKMNAGVCVRQDEKHVKEITTEERIRLVVGEFQPYMAVGCDEIFPAIIKKIIRRLLDS